ncbi:unnamed protein product [Clavelina lepadiformis]|uniref:HEAT repeat-containing protein 1 n=1 Tax=Clavelina lepadiformis TaxID=159417 RepID=A0ABP0FBT7_CLALP
MNVFTFELILALPWYSSTELTHLLPRKELSRSCKLLSMMTKLQETVTQQASYASVDDFLKIYFTCVLTNVFTDSAHDDGTAIKCGNALKTIIENSHLTVSVQKHIFRLLISCYKSNRQQVPLGIIKEVLVQMQQKYIDTFNEALSETKDDSDNVFNSLLISLSSVESQVHIEYGIALSHGLMHADCSIWSQALYRMHSLILNEQGDEEAQSFVLQTVEGILKYDVIKPDVMLETLKLLSLCKQGILMKAASQIRQNLMKLIETHMSDEVWHNTVQLAIQCLTNHAHGTKQDCTDFCEKNQVTNFLLKLLLRNLVCDANHGVKCLTIVFAKSEFVKEHIFLNELILTMSQSDSEGDTMSKILTALADIIKKKELYNDVVELLHALSTDYNKLSDLSLHFFWIAVSWHVGSNCPNIFFMGCKLLYSATTYFQKTLQGTIHLEHIDCDINSLLSHMFDHTMKSVTSQHFFLLICKAWHQIITAAAKFKKHFTSNEVFIPCTSLSVDCISDNPCLISMDKWAASIVAHLLNMSGQISFSDETAIQVVNNTLFHLFDCMIRGVDDLLQFLSYILQQVLLSDKYDSLVCVSVLYLACNIIRLTRDISENESKIILQTSNSIIPAVMIACTSTKYGIRKAAVVTIQAMASLNEFSLVDLFQFLDKFSNEILVDAGQCSSVIAEYFSWEKREETTSKLLNELFLKHVVPSHKMNINLRANLYDKCFSQIDNILELQIMLPTIETFLKTLKTNPESFDESSCTMLKQFLRKVSSSLKVDSKYLQILLFFLRLDGIEIAERKVHQIFFDLQGFTIGLINNKFFKPLPDQVKQIILHELISINTTTPSTIVGAGSVKAFKSLTLDSSLVVCELLSKAEMVVNPTTTLSNTITAKFLSTQTAISSSDTEKSWKELTVLLELLHHKKRITKLHKLVGPLFQILEEITNISYDSHDYIILLILGCLLNVFKRITYGDPHVKTEIRNAVKVEFLIKCIHSSDNTNIHQLALLLILEAVSICPEKVLHSVMSIFTFMGNILMRKDDSYSFQVMTHIIRIIVPRLISMRENTEEGRQNNDAVLDILQVFVDAWLHVPSHRR